MLSPGVAMSKCKECQTTENIVYSGVDALLLGIPNAETETTCYPCANKEKDIMSDLTSNELLEVLYKHTYNLFRQQKRELLRLLSIMPKELPHQHEQIVKVLAILEDNIRNENN